jgi:hypothetical protein
VTAEHCGISVQQVHSWGSATRLCQQPVVAVAEMTCPSGHDSTQTACAEHYAVLDKVDAGAHLVCGVCQRQRGVNGAARIVTWREVKG